ncbi:MAG TPA: response regulator [Candidatus Ozemobacteraceae bacterium]|nr:response regulator [Candidatus Ozemobacteraceae bacterium]HQG27885.1 response regulator [Candidatus Ozemobacteraceae bacterium]
MERNKILVADDEPHILRVVKDKLANAGFSVVTASNGEEALESARREKPALVLLDVMMPKMNGFDVCRALRAEAEFKSVPILLLTARGQEIDRHMGLDAGASEYITKPFSPRELLATVQAQLEAAKTV